MALVEMDLDFQNIIEHPPIAPQQMYQNACSSDSITIESWRKAWVEQYIANHKKFGPFKDRGIGKLFNKFSMGPAIIAGSGPSLKKNTHHLKDRPKGMPVISCLHNFHFMEDTCGGADYYVTLDAGPVVVEEVSEGGTRPKEEYWELTKDRTLLAFVGSPPELLERWKGEIVFFNCVIPDPKIAEAFDAVEKFRTYVSTGGNVLGACLYIAKGIMGANPICFIGADFSFGYTKKFHAWDSKYDKNLGNVVKAWDVYGNKVLTWQSYANFKQWFDFVSLQVPGLYVNCTEGGMLGAYPEGNLASIKQMELEKFLKMYQINENVRESCENPETDIRKILF